MLRFILPYGLAAGLIVAVPMFAMLLLNPDPKAMTTSQLFGFGLMAVALSLIFFGVKQYRDKVQGGVIKFVPALLVGLGISAVAGLVYVIGWEITLQATNFSFIESYSAGMLENARAKGASAAEIEKMAADMARFREQYANPLFRLPITFIEIFPVGLVISLITAALLRNPRLLPARQAAA
jgi:NADH:ubiquinone oxidoreductase subunit K